MLIISYVVTMYLSETIAIIYLFGKKKNRRTILPKTLGTLFYA